MRLPRTRVRSVVVAVAAVALFAVGSSAGAGQAVADSGRSVQPAESPVQPPKPPLEPSEKAKLPAAVNDWQCVPSPEHPRPVVLVHGLTGSASTNWATLAPKLLDEGYCVYALTYGKPPGLPPIAGGFGPIEDSAVEFGEFLDRVLAESGTEQVDLVGHSEGTLMPQYYLKFLDGAPNVHRYVALTPLYDGTTLHSASEILDRLATEVPGVGEIADALCVACRQMLHGSELLGELNAGGAAVPGIEYTTIMTKLDATVTPYTSGHLDSPEATNIVLQDECPGDLSGHLATAFNPAVGRMVLNALDPEHQQPVEC